MKKTYGVSGMVEWTVLIPVGRSSVRIRFTGGSISGYGVTPATYTTDNPALMHLIENSQLFRRKRITLLRTGDGQPKKRK